MRPLALTAIVALALIGLIAGADAIVSLDRLGDDMDRNSAELRRALDERAELIERWAAAQRKALAEQEAMLERIEAME